LDFLLQEWFGVRANAVFRPRCVGSLILTNLTELRDLYLLVASNCLFTCEASLASHSRPIAWAAFFRKSASGHPRGQNQRTSAAQRCFANPVGI
jgi:hypothetical protein